MDKDIIIAVLFGMLLAALHIPFGTILSLFATLGVLAFVALFVWDRNWKRKHLTRK